MILLGIDTSTPATTVGLRLSDGTVLQARDDPPAGGRPGHATRLLTLADGLLADAGIRWRGIERIAVGVGPGTFTGLRVGVASAHGLAHALGAQLVGISSLRALAHGANTQRPDCATILAVIDARRGEAFCAAYTGQRELTPPRAMGPAALGELGEELSEHGTWLAVGNGALAFAAQLRGAGGELPEDSSALHRIGAEAICQLGLDAPAGDPRAVLPQYCRRPDAEITLESAAK